MKKMKNKRLGVALILLGLLLIAAAVLLSAYGWRDERRAEAAALDVVKQIREVIRPQPQDGESRNTPENGQPAEGERTDPYRDMPTVEIDGYRYIGTLTIPPLETELPIMEEWDHTPMKTALCRYSGTVYLDNMVICGYNYQTHFGRLDKLQKNDSVIFTDVEGNSYEYKVAETELLVPTAVEEMKTGDWDMTLFTCNYSGRARVTVRCVKVR